jgi:hypothetical protein
MDHVANIKSQLLVIAEAVKGSISTPDLAGSGKLQPAKSPSKVKRGPELIDEEKSNEVEKSATEEPAPPEAPRAFMAEIVKADKRLVTGLVLQPEVVDGQGDIMDSEVIRIAAHDWLARFGKKTKLGLQHESFMKNESRFVLAESYLAPMDFALGTRLIKAGSWLMTVKVLDDKIWKDVKAGQITGFSIGGRATAEAIKE